MTTGSETLQRQTLHPATAEQIESKLAARHIEYTFEPNLPLAAIHDIEGHQVRLERNRAPKQIVQQYAEQMNRGAVFPAIVVNERRQLIDGKARCQATLKNGQTVIAAYVCIGMTALEVRSLSIELNQSHGLRMTDQEVRAFIAGTVREGRGLDTKSHARMTGIKPSTIAKWVAVEKARARASLVGLVPDDLTSLSEGVQVALQGARLDAVFRAGAELAIATNVPAAEISKVVARANAAVSERDALAIVESERRVHTERVRAADGQASSRRSMGPGLHVGGLLRFDVEDLLDVAPEKQHEAFLGLRMVRDLLNAAVETAKTQWKMPIVAENQEDLIKVA